MALATLVSALVLAACVFIDKGLVSSFLFKAKVLNKKLAAQKQIKANEDAIDKLKQNYSPLKGGYTDLILRSLPVRPNYPAMVSMMEALAGVSGVELKGISTETQDIDPVPPPGPVVPMGYTVSIAGSYDKIQVFLRNLEHAARPMSVKSLNLNGGSGNLSADLTFDTYYQPPASIELGTETVK